MQYALTWSQNIASVWLLDQIGLQTGIQFAQNDGIQFTKQETQQLCTAIGCEDVSPVQMAQAYEPFDNNGLQMQTYLINRIVAADGTVVYSHTPVAKQVMQSATATTMLRLLEDVVDYGTGQAAQVSGWGVAGKTGTVQYDSGLQMTDPNWVSDAWFDGMTPAMVGSVYIGYDKSTAQDHMSWVYKDPSANAAQIFGDIVRLAVQGEAGQVFPVGPFAAAQGTEYAAYNLTNPVSGLKASYSAATQAVTLSWQSSAVGTDQFMIQRSTLVSPPGSNAGGQQLTPIGQTASLTYTDGFVSPGATYEYVVQAVNPSTGAPVGKAMTVQLQIPGAPTPPNGRRRWDGLDPLAGGMPHRPATREHRRPWRQQHRQQQHRQFGEPNRRQRGRDQPDLATIQSADQRRWKASITRHACSS